MTISFACDSRARKQTNVKYGEGSYELQTEKNKLRGNQRGFEVK